MIGACQLAQHERVEPVRLAARDAEARPGRGDLVWVQREHAQPGVQQPLDQHPVRALDRHQLHVQAHQLAAQRPQARLVMRKRRGQQLLAGRVLHDHVVLLRRPVDARETTFHSYSSLVRSSQRPDHEVPLRALIDRPSNGATSCCHFWHLTPAGRGWSNAGPLTGKLERPSPGGGRGHRDLNGRDYIRMTNELESS